MAQGSTADLQNKAAETGGNLSAINSQLQIAILETMQSILVEMRVQTDVLMVGLNVEKMNVSGLRSEYLNAIKNDPNYGG